MNRKDWANKLIDALSSYRIAYKTTLNMSPYRIAYKKPYHLPVELEHQAWWTVKTLNYDLTTTGEERRL